jgi:hypothetical protein
LKPFWNNKDNVDVFATTASRRMVVVREGSKTLVQPAGTFIETRSVESCAEPPPDVGEVFSAAVAGGLQAAASLSKGDDTRLGATLAGQFARQVATQIAPLLYRTQGLQLNRDAQYVLCIDRLSGYIRSDDEYMDLKKNRFDEAVKLIAAELPNMSAVQTAYYNAWKTDGEKVDVKTVKEILDAAKPTALPIPQPETTK